MMYKRSSDDPDKVLVVFEIPGTIWAERVNLVGDFNDWDRESLPFRQDRRGNWVIEIELTLGQTYRFRYLFDGTTWCDEWASDGYVPNDYGTFDGLVVAKLPEDG